MQPTPNRSPREFRDTAHHLRRLAELNHQCVASTGSRCQLRAVTHDSSTGVEALPIESTRPEFTGCIGMFAERLQRTANMEPTEGACR